jgi:hypothetical protein
MEFAFHNSYIILGLVSQCSDFLDRVQLLTQKLLKQGYVAHRLKWQLKNGYCGDDGWLLRNMYQMTMDLFPFLCSITDKTFTWLDYMSDTAGILSETGTAYPSRSPRFTSCICYFFILFFVLFFVVGYLLSFLCCVVIFCFVCHRPVSYLPNIASVSG